MDWASIIGGVGIGAILTSCANYYFSQRASHKKNVFDKKETAYLGLLEALYKAEIDRNAINAKNYGLWHNRIALVGSPDILKYSQLMIDSEAGSSERKIALDNLLQSMREDLKIDVRKLIS